MLAKMGLDIVVYGRKRYRVSDSGDVKTVWLPCLHSQCLETFSYVVFAYFHILFFNRPDIVHIHGIGPALFAPLFRLISCKVVVTHHGQNYFHKKWNLFFRQVFKTGEKFGVMFANRVIALNERTRDFLAEKYKTAKALVIRNGVEIPKQKNSRGGGFALAMGRFTQEKGFMDLVDAICLNPDFQDSRINRMVIAGMADHDSPYSRNLIKKAKKLGVELPGFVHGEAKDKLFLECTLFISPSHNDEQPIALLEALAYGCRVAASDIPSHKELGLPEECYFPAGDVEAIGKILSSGASGFRQLDYDEMLKEKYDWNVIAQKTKEVYDAV
jgi:glycosyltransferase involved in cell wall biosynthesis